MRAGRGNCSSPCTVLASPLARRQRDAAPSRWMRARLMVVDVIFGGVTTVSLGILTWQHAAAHGFRFRRTVTARDRLPDLTLLKPMKGRDDRTRECLQSWLTQDYPGRVVILCGVADGDDPALHEIEGLRKDFPQAELQCVVCPDVRAINPKVSTLIQLEPRIDTPLVLLSDADVWVEAGFLTRTVSEHQAAGAGLTHVSPA